MSDIFDGVDPILIAKKWLKEAEITEINDANAMALASVDQEGCPNVRMVLLKEIESNAFIFYTNYNSVKANEIVESGNAAMVIHWKSLRRQVRVRGRIEKTSSDQANQYFVSRSLNSRYGAIASDQSKPLDSRETLLLRASKVADEEGQHPRRPKNWGGFKIIPFEIELGADDEDRIHDRFRYIFKSEEKKWSKQRLYP